MTINPYSSFLVDPKKEKEGVPFTYNGMFRVWIARGGVSNKKYVKKFADLLKPYGDIQNIPAERDRPLVIEAYFDTVIIGWEVNTGDFEEPVWSAGMHNAEGEVVEFNLENCIALLADDRLHDLWEHIQANANNRAHFTAEQTSKQAKN